HATESIVSGGLERAPRAPLWWLGTPRRSRGAPRPAYTALGSTERARGVTMPRTSAPKSGERPSEATASVQDYLAAVYDLTGSGKPVIGARLAKHMNISAPAVTEAIHRMTRGGYVKVGRHKALTLTTKGKQIAEVMARRHRLLERWLTDTLGLNWT